MQGKLSVSFHLVSLVIVGLVAYIVFSNPTIEPEKGTKILDITPSELSHMVLVEETRRIDLAPRKDGGFTLTVSKAPRTLNNAIAEMNINIEEDDQTTGQQEDTKRQAARNDDQPVSNEPKTTSYRASTIFEDRLKRLLPLVVERNLGKVTEEQMNKYRLVEPKSTLEIETKGQKVRYAVGGKTFGGATTYIQQLPDGPVYLLASDLLRTLDVKPGGYMERRLVGFEQDKVDTINLESNKLRQVLIQKGKGRFGKWVPARNPDTKNSIFNNWVKGVTRTPIEDYVTDEGLMPKTKEKVKIVFKKGNKVIDTIRLASFKPKDTKSKTIFYVRSTFVGQWVTIRSSDAERILSELPSVLENE